MKVTFFESPAAFRKWLEEHHDTTQELWVGYYKKGSGKPSMTWPESVNEALSYGWIDGVRKGIDEESYRIRFSPRKPGSTWSATNIKLAQELIDQGLMQPAGLQAFQARQEDKSAIYSYEQRDDRFPEEYAEKLQQDTAAWDFFQAQPPWYQKAARWWVVSAKKEETRLRRLDKLIEDSAAGRTVPPLTRRKSSS